ncbi:hypothetical protein MSG28_007063 [Choristoneura fumiferana]|uniref:Uncharacterized protein n=1 Tax=Choristoneura fumiferana TaxID=7141 RepID=A0ACC0JMG6_CHOFU|nr:hypothetical protein MSG28_007063 [Choristoneura fumiferana]
MPPRTRGVKASKTSKENINIITKNKVKTAKPVRKPLADKTNSASDENASPEPVKKVIQKSTKSSRKVVPNDENASPEPVKKVIQKNTKSSRKIVPDVIDEERPRRNRRLPTRYVENLVLNNLSNSKESAISPSKLNAKSPVKNSSKVESPFKSPINLDNSLLANRPRRVSRLPSKFDDQSESPNKATIQPCHTSTPLVPKSKNLLNNVPRTLSDKQKGILDNELLQKEMPQKILQQKVTPQKVIAQKAKQLKVTPQKQTKVVPQKVISQNNKQMNESPQNTKHAQTKLVQKKLSDIVKDNTHANIDTKRTRRVRKPVEYKEVTLSPKLKSPETTKPSNNNGKKILKASSSFRVLEDKKENNRDNLDVYEFTFDPTQEPPPQKKKKKKVTNRKQAKPKTRVYNNNYEKNLARALADLKNTVNKKTEKGGIPSSAANNNAQQVAITQPPVPNQSGVVICTTAQIHNNPDNNNTVKSKVVTKNHASIRVEDIAADFEATIDHHDDINYSPVNSPHCNDIEPNNTGNVTPDREAIIRFDDPLNLRNELSFFDEQPVASSSMNMSTRNPTATPWRVEFENLPIKWQANTYVKPDMTPALESSYINQFDDGKKKHVYTNMIAQENDVLPDIIENEAPKLKQTSIISFIKEVIERSASKKKKLKETPKKANSLFDDPNTSVNTVGNKTPSKDKSDSSEQITSKENETSAELNKVHKRKNDGDINPTPAKVSRKDKENTLFGFDDSENQQENMSPVEIVNKNRLRNLRSRSGAVLKELNKQTGPMRVDLPAAMKTKMAPSSDVVEKIFDQMKSATDAPVLLDAQEDGVETTNVADMPVERASIDDDSQSVHLFEDIELVHHVKPTRKSYGKSKKVTFRQHSSDSEERGEVARNLSSDEEDLSFHLPEVKTKRATKKKKTKKQLLSKKEKAEVDAWAACFNSMCEDIEEFDLVVE